MAMENQNHRLKGRFAPTRFLLSLLVTVMPYLFEVLKDVTDDQLLRLIGVDPSVGVHVNDCIFKPNEWEPQCSLQGLLRTQTTLYCICRAPYYCIHAMMPDGKLQTTALDYSVFSLMKLLLQPIKQRQHLYNELQLFVLWFAYLEVRGQLMWGEDTQFDLRKTDLQVLKIIAFWGSHIFAGSLVKVFIQLFHLWNTKSLTC